MTVHTWKPSLAGQVLHNRSVIRDDGKYAITEAHTFQTGATHTTFMVERIDRRNGKRKFISYRSNLEKAQQEYATAR